MKSFYSRAMHALFALVVLVGLTFLPQKAQANSVDQCISDAAKQAYACGSNIAEVAAAGAGVIEKGLAFLASYPQCVNDVLNLNWITIGISGAITTLGAIGQLPTHSQASCEAGIYGVAAKPIAKGVTSLGIPGSSALQPYVEGYAVEGFKSAALAIPIPSVGAPNLAAQFECGCAIPVMGAAVMEDIRKGIQAAKGAAKNCSALAGTLYKCGKAAVMAVLTDPAGAAASAGGWVADKVDDAYDYLTGGCQNPPVEEYFSKAFAPHVSNVAHADANTGDGMGQQHFGWWSNDLYGKCVKFFDDCNSTQKTAERQCRAMRHGVMQSDGNGWMVGRGFYQLVRTRQYEYEITRALYDKAGPLHAEAEKQANERVASIPKELLPIVSSGGTVNSIVARQKYHVDKALGINYSGLVQNKGLPAPGQKAYFTAGSLGFLMSQRAEEIGKEGHGEAPAGVLPRARAQAIAQEYIDSFNPVQMAADAMEGEYAEKLRKYLTASSQQCIAVGEVFTCVKPEAQAMCVKAQGVVKPSPTCELDWKKAAQLMLKDNKKCVLTDASVPSFSCETVADSQSCEKVMSTLGQSSNSHCSLNMDKLMADNSCPKPGNKYICESVKGSNTCESAAQYLGKNPSSLCDINIDKSMAKVKECTAMNLGSGPLSLKGYQCSTYWAQEDCKAIHLEANSKTDANLYCKVDVVSADKAAGERSVGVLSTVANTCTAQGAVVTCPRDVQLARCKKEPYLKECKLLRTPQYDNLVKLAQSIRAELSQGLDKKMLRSTPIVTPGMQTVSTSSKRAPTDKDIDALTFYPSDDPLYLDSVGKIPDINYLNEVLKSHHPEMKPLSFCKGSEKNDPDGLDQLTVCAPGLSEAFNKWIADKAKEINEKTQTAPPGGGKGPAALIAAKVDARINPADVAKGGDALAARGQMSGSGVMNAATGLQTAAQQVAGGQRVTGPVASGANALGVAGIGMPLAPGMAAQVSGSGALAAGVGGAQQAMMGQASPAPRNSTGAAGAGSAVGIAGIGVPAAPSMGALSGAPTAAQLGNAGGLGANLPGGSAALPMGAGGTQQVMMGQASPPSSGGQAAPSTPAARPSPTPPAASALPAIAPVSTPSLGTPHQQLMAANCSTSSGARGSAAIAPADGAYVCPAGAGQTLCEGLQRNQPALVKRCSQAAPSGR